MGRGVAGFLCFLLAMLWPLSAAHASQGYTVRQGDTLWRISHHFGVRPADLATANHLTLTSVIHPGLRLTVPGSSTPMPGPDAPPQGTLPQAIPPQPSPEHAGAPDLTRMVSPTRSAAPTRAAGLSERIVRKAYEFLGRPYKWSGMGNNGFDCSGLITRVFAALGRFLPHTSFGQYLVGAPVPRGELAPGDLVFFHTYTAGASHVGIYIGGSQFIHASYSRGVAVSSIEEPYFRARYLGARRF